MRQMITGLIAAVAVMAAAPAMACGFNPCGAPVYSAPVATYGYGYGYSGCNPCGGGVAERLPDPDDAYPDQAQQYYYINQGPTYTGPGNWAPRPYYREGYGRPYYGYHHYGYGYRHYGYRAYHHYRPAYHQPHYGYHYGYAPRHAYAPYHYGHPVLRRYY
jgi:hypothetical protein